MEPRRLSTGDVLAMGILSRPNPQTDIPLERERFDGSSDDFRYVGDAAVREALEAGKLVNAPNYYGIPYIWKTEAGYRGMLLQYRNVTEDHAWASADEAVEWFHETYHATDG